MVQCVLPQFFPDLQDEAFTTKFVIYHRRFSTSTTPTRPLAQPIRVVGHTGEINTLIENVIWARPARSPRRSLPRGCRTLSPRSASTTSS